MTEVVSQELIMLPTAAVATKFIDFAKQKEAQNRGNPMTSAAISIAEASGLTVSVSSGSQKHLGSGSSNVQATRARPRTPSASQTSGPRPGPLATTRLPVAASSNASGTKMQPTGAGPTRQRRTTTRRRPRVVPRRRPSRLARSRAATGPQSPSPTRSGPASQARGRRPLPRATVGGSRPTSNVVIDVYGRPPQGFPYSATSVTKVTLALRCDGHRGGPLP